MMIIVSLGFAGKLAAITTMWLAGISVIICMYIVQPKVSYITLHYH